MFDTPKRCRSAARLAQHGLHDQEIGGEAQLSQRSHGLER